MRRRYYQTFTTGMHPFSYLPCVFCEDTTLHKSLTCVHCSTQFPAQIAPNQKRGIRPLTIKGSRRKT